jgi:hypothetical protein
MQAGIPSPGIKWLIVALYLTAMLAGFGILNSLVSLKYETQDPTACISWVSGRDLCADLLACQIASITCFLAASCLVVWRYGRTPSSPPNPLTKR